VTTDDRAGVDTRTLLEVVVRQDVCVRPFLRQVTDGTIGQMTVREIADQLGHKRTSITQDTYLGRKNGPVRAADVLREIDRGSEQPTDRPRRGQVQ
jgi:hypothetical protein